MPFNIFSILTCFFSLFIVPVLGQNIYSLGIEHGLSNNNVTSICKDKYGFMWFGTINGLSRFDGYTFTKFRRKIGDSTSLPDNTISALEYANEKMYVGTGNGVAILDNQTLKFSKIQFQSEESNSKSITLNRLVSAIKVNKGTLYIGTTTGLFVLKAGEKKAVHVPLYKGGKTLRYPFNSIAIDPNNNDVWLAGKEGLYVYSPRLHKIKVVNDNLSNINTIKFDDKGNLWVGTDTGLFILERRTKLFRRYSVPGLELATSRIRDCSFEKPDILWVATAGDGVSTINLKNNSLIHHFNLRSRNPLSSNAIYTVYIDNKGRKWMGTMRGGINLIDNNKDVFTTYRHDANNSNSLIHNIVFAFCEDGDNIWIGTDGGGISVWNRKNNTFSPRVFKDTSQFHPGHNQVTSIVKDSDQNIWVASYGAGLKKMRHTTGRFEQVPFAFNANNTMYPLRLFIDKDKDIWAACIKGPRAGPKGFGLFKFDKKVGIFVAASPATNKDIFSIAEDKIGNLWLGTINSVISFNKKSYKSREFMTNSYTRALYPDNRGYLWIGTYGNGLLRYDIKKGKFKTYTEQDGLSNDIIVNIEADNFGNLWLATYDGLSKFNPRTSKFENFHAADGLQSNQFYYNASAKLSTGELLFGGIKGFNIFNPANIKTEKHFPPLFITEMRVQNTPVSSNSEFTSNAPSIHELKHIELPYAKSTFSIDFVAIDYSFPEKIRYAYFLKGKDKEWNYTNNIRTINYSSLMEGSYTLQLNSTNSSGIWNPKPIEINITILPPWHRSWWAYCLYLLAMGSVVYIYVYYQKEKSRLQYDLKLETELNEKKISFFTNIAHELRTPLTLIVNPISDLLTNKEQNINFVDVSAVHRNTKRLLSLVDQLLLFKSTDSEISGLKPEVLNLVEVCNEVFLCFNNQVKAKKINYSFENASDQLLVFADREKIEIVLFNLISNAIKYSDSQGSISFVLREENGNAVMSVTNTGTVIPEHIGDKLFEKFFRLDQVDASSKKSGFGIGLFVSKKIAKIQGGSLSYSSKAEEGTVFVYKIPTHAENITEEAINMEKSASTPLLSELLTDTADSRPELKQTVSENMNQVYEGVIEQRPKVLIVDDNAEIRGYIDQLLKTSYTIFEAENAESALEILKKTEPDLIISDIVMPGMSGVEFCSKVKETIEYSHIPVILLTGTSSPEVKLKGIECGADDYITKPFEKDLLIARIKSILKGRDTLKKFFFNEVTLRGNNEKVPQEYSTFLKTGIEIVERHIEDRNFNVKVFITEMKMSRATIYKKVKAISGLSITEFIRYIRLKKAAELMIKTDIRVMEVCYAVGINDPKYFRQQFSKIFGMPPSKYKQKYRRTFLRAPGS